MSQLQMGGGGAMRAAARIAVGVSRPGLRNSPLPAEQSIRNATRQSGVGVSSQAAKSAEATTTETPPEVTVLSQWDDWYLADDGELDVPSSPPLPSRSRLVSVPTLTEAEQATQELKEAIDQLYLSGESVLSPTLDRSPVIGAFSNPFSNPVPTHAIQAFHMLSSSQEVQTVVASIVSDQNVWDAVRKNPAVTSFFQEIVLNKEAAVADKEGDKLSSCASSTDETPEETDVDVTSDSHPGRFVNFLHNVKLTVTELVSKVSSYLQKIFPTLDTPRENGENADGNTKASFMDNIGLQGAFLGLAVMVIMVIMTKRGIN